MSLILGSHWEIKLDREQQPVRIKWMAGTQKSGRQTTGWQKRNFNFTFSIPWQIELPEYQCGQTRRFTLVPLPSMLWCQNHFTILATPHNPKLINLEGIKQYPSFALIPNKCHSLFMFWNSKKVYNVALCQLLCSSRQYWASRTGCEAANWIQGIVCPGHSMMRNTSKAQKLLET